MSGIGITRLGDGDPQRLGGYHLLWRLASGGMGRIYLARPAAGGPIVAVKTLLAEGAVSSVDRQRFTREVELAQRIDSAYTARVLEADADAERPWMAIQYVPAPSLADLVRDAGPLAEWGVPSIAAGAVQVLMSLHSKGVVHRDVKPQNILLPLTGPLLIDFGISHAFDRTRTSVTLGTIAFTSPEQARGEPSTEASDVFSLGATLFHLAVGRPPYPEVESPMVLLALVQAGRLDLARLPRELIPLIEPCLAVDPKKRPALSGLLETALETDGRASARRRGRRWLPVEWTAVINAYEAYGRALDMDRTVTGDGPTRPLPPPAPTLVEPRERAARLERERRAEEARRRRDGEVRRLAEAAARERAGRERNAAGGSQSVPRPRGPRSGTGGWAVAAVVIAIAVLLWQPWTAMKGASDSSDRPYSSAQTTSGGGGATGTRTQGAGTIRTSAPTPTSTEDDDQRETAQPSPSPTPTPSPTPSPSPTRDRVEEAFKAVRTGSCLTLYDTGYGDGHIKWNVDAPPDAVSCSSDQAHVQVTAVTSGSCPTGTGKSYWSYGSTNLCLKRVFRVGFCLLGEKSGEKVLLGAMTLVDCRATRIPVKYDYILHVTGVYRAPSNAGPDHCKRVQGDTTKYMAWLVDDNSVLLCTMFYRSG